VRRNCEFRNIKWGDSPEIVLEYETAEPIHVDEDQNEILVFEDKIVGLNTYIICYFDLDLGLYHAVYGINEQHTTNYLYITNYDDLKAALTEEYGTALEDDVITINDAARLVDDGTALYYGYTIYNASWETDNTEISLGMISDNFEIKTVVDYLSKDIIPSVDTSGF
jgi:hypothetical protein